MLSAVTAAQTAFSSFQRRNTPFPANFIADRAAEDGAGEAFRSSRRRFRLVHDGGVSKSVKIVKTIPGRRATLRSAGRGSGVTSAGNIASPRPRDRLKNG